MLVGQKKSPVGPCKNPAPVVSPRPFAVFCLCWAELVGNGLCSIPSGPPQKHGRRHSTHG